MNPLNNQFDDLQLDEMLKKYGDAEPRPGLEGRVLARLTSQREHSTAKRWWQLAVAAVAIGVVAGTVILGIRKPAPRVETLTNRTPLVDADKREAPLATSNTGQVTSPKRHAKLQVKPQRPISSEPRLEQFPAPAPLNEQERLLARYVRERRSEAVIMARALEEIRKQNLARFAEESPSDQ